MACVKRPARWFLVQNPRWSQELDSSRQVGDKVAGSSAQPCFFQSYEDICETMLGGKGSKTLSADMP